MIEFKLKNTLLRLDFSFFAVVALFLFLDSSGFGLAALTACAVHELSHLAVMTAFGIAPEAVTFYGAGIRISSARTEYAAMTARVLILAAGCAANFTAAALFWISGQLPAAAINLFTGIFNLLPIGELDGAALLKTLFIRLCRPENVDRCMKLSGLISAALVMIAVITAGGGVSFTLVTTALYIIIVSSREL
ncbi:MAG: peptidase M50 [Oscillospiraceae bacterium]|nr:peptidase M50 [Oscillospiraceae bacterium]